MPIIKKINNLINKDIKTKDEFLPSPYYADLPKPYFLSYIVGARGSGKSTALCNMWLKQYSFLTRTWLISPTIMNDPKMKETFLGKKNVNVSMELTEQTLNDIIDEIKALISEWKEYQEIKKLFERFIKYGEDKLSDADLMKLQACNFNPQNYEMAINHKPHFLIIIDDGQGSPLFAGHKTNTEFNKFVIQHRHHFTSLIIAVQSYKGNSSVFRQQLSHFMLFKIRDGNKLREIYKEMEGAFKDENEFLDLYHEATSQKHEFLYVDTDAKENQIRKNFDLVLKSY